MQSFGSSWSALLTGAVAAVVTSACTPQTFVSAPSAASAPISGITVSGMGKVNGKPNVARSTVGVEARATSAEGAISEVNARMAQVIAAVKRAGVADADVRTSSLSLNFERIYEPPRPLPQAESTAVTAAAPAAPSLKPKAPAGSERAPVSAPPAAAPAAPLPQGFYNASNNVEVTIRDLEHAGLVLSAATGAGANQLFGIRFEIEDTTALLVEARKKAVEDARGRAERLAQLSGVKLGGPVSITELEGGSTSPSPAFAMMRSDASVPVERGELSVTSSVQIVYSLKD